MGRSLYIGSFCPEISLSRYLEEAAFSILISSSVFIFLWLFSSFIMDIIFSIVFVGILYFYIGNTDLLCYLWCSSVCSIMAK